MWRCKNGEGQMLEQESLERCKSLKAEVERRKCRRWKMSSRGDSGRKSKWKEEGSKWKERKKCKGEGNGKSRGNECMERAGEGNAKSREGKVNGKRAVEIEEERVNGNRRELKNGGGQEEM